MVDWKTSFSVGSVSLRWVMIHTNKNKTEIEQLYTHTVYYMYLYTMSYLCHYIVYMFAIFFNIREALFSQLSLYMVKKDMHFNMQI